MKLLGLSYFGKFGFNCCKIYPKELLAFASGLDFFYMCQLMKHACHSVPIDETPS